MTLHGSVANAGKAGSMVNKMAAQPGCNGCCRYGRDNVFRQMTDVLFCAAMGPPGGGRTFVTNRYLRHFNTLALAQVSDLALQHIFRSILEWHVAKEGFASTIKNLIKPIIGK